MPIGLNASRFLPNHRIAAVCCCVLLSSCGDSGKEATTTRPDDHRQPGGTRLVLPTSEPIVRVRLESARDSGERIPIGDDGIQLGFELHDASIGSSDGPVEIERRGHRWIVVHGGREIIDRDSREPLVISGSGPMPVGDRGSGSHRFSGTLHCIPHSNGSDDDWDLVEHVAMGDYIPGVLMGELYAGWTSSCFEAQAVAARSYACMEIQMRSSRDWDVMASPRSQAYIGATDDRTALEARDATRGLVLAWNDELVPGYFSSCCGGLAATAALQISPSPVNRIPPLNGHDGPDPCTDSPLYSWKIERSASSLGDRLEAWAVSNSHRSLRRLTSLKSIQVHERNEHDRPTVLRITDQGGRTADLGIEEFLFASNYDHDGPPSKNLWSGWSTGVVDRDRIVLHGRGFGHGVGLCQYGAQELGIRGKTFREILSWYYPGSSLHAAW